MAMPKKYSSFANDYDSYTRYFNNWTRPLNSGSPSNELVESMYNNMRNDWESKWELPNKRTLLDRTFDALLLPNYMVAGAVDGMVRDDKTVLEGITGGFKAGQFFGDGYEEGETTFSDVLGNAGWNPESTLGKFAKGATGFVLDVALDPTTYLSGGASALVKGTGRVGKTADDLTALANRNDVKSHVLSRQYDDTVENLTKQGVSKERAERFAYQKFWDNASTPSSATHMTEDIAEGIIREQMAQRGFKMTDEQIKGDAKRFADKYNKIQGIRDVDGGAPITWGLANFPFAEKIFKGKEKNLTWTLSDGQTVRAFSDRIGLSKKYQDLRASIYGTNIGKLFSTTSPLWKLSQEDPAKLYDYVKFMEYTKGLEKNKLTAEKAIRDKAKAIGVRFTPDEQKEILELLQDKTVWGKVKDNLKFAETKAGMELQTLMKQSATKMQEEVDELLNNKRTVEQMRDAIDGEMLQGAKYIDELELEHRENLANINLDLVQDKTKLDEIVNTMKQEISRIDSELSTLEKTNGVPVEDLDRLFNESLDEQLKADEYFKTIEPLQKQLDQVNANRKNAGEGIDETRSAEAETIAKALKFEIEEMKKGKPEAHKRFELIDTLSETIFGQKGKLSPNLKGDALKNLVTMFKEGKTSAEVRKHINDNVHLYSEHATEVYKFLAKKHGYKDWKSTYHEPMAKLKEKLKNDGDLNHWDYQEYLRLETLRVRRANDFKKLFDRMTYKEFKEFKRNTRNNEEMLDMYERINAKLKPHERIDMTDEERIAMRTDDLQTQRIGSTPIRKEIGTMNRGGKSYKVYEVETTIKLATKEKSVTKKRYVDEETGEVYRLDKGNLVKTQERVNMGRANTSTGEPRTKSEILDNDSYTTMYNRAVENYINAQSRKAGKNVHHMKDALLGESAKEMIESTVQSMGQLLLQNFKGKSFDDLTRGQQDYLIKMGVKHAKSPKSASEELAKLQANALREAERRAGVSRIEAVVDEVEEGHVISWHDGTRARAGKVTKAEQSADGTKYTVTVRGETHEVYARDVKGVRINKEDMTPDDLVMNSKATRDYVSEKEKLSEQLLSYEKQLSDIDNQMIQNEKSLIKEYRGRVREQKEVLRNLEETRKIYDETLESIDEAGIENLQAKIAEYEDAIIDTDALEAWVRVHSRSDLELLRDPERYSRVGRFSSDEYPDGRLGSTGEGGARVAENIDKKKFFSAIIKRGEMGMYKDMKYDDFKKLIDTPEKMEKFIIEHELSHFVNQDWLKTNRNKGDLNDKRTFKIEQRADMDAINMLKPMGQEYIDDVVNTANITESAKTLLMNKASSDKVAEQVKVLYEEFKKIGEDEVAIGKLSKEQFDEMLGRYVPHILTDDGRQYFDELRELEPHKAGLTQDLGYGRKWNPHAQSRTIDGKSIEEINEYFRDKLKGKNLFSENIADIYLIRALKNNELMYDNQYMNEMMNVFGKEIGAGGVEEGYKAVVNYGQLRNQIKKMVDGEAMNAKARGVKVTAEWYDRATNDVLSKLGLPENALDDIATPMIELTEEQLMRINPLGIAVQVNSAIVQKANQTRKLQIAKDQNRFLQMYDKFLHFMKLNQTTVMPAFHIRNWMSNKYLNWLGVGKDAVNPRMQWNAMQASRHLGDAEKLKDLKPLVSDDGTKTWHWNELYELAKVHGVIDEGFFAKDIGAGSATKGLFSKKIKPKYDPTNTENFILYRKGAEVGTVVENTDRLVHFASMLKQGKSIEEAGESSRKFLFDYSDLTAFEQSVMKRIFPYYTWLRKNGRLQVSQLLDQPGKYRDTAKALNAIEGGVSEEDKVSDRYLSDFAKDWVQTPFSSTNEKGAKEPIMFNPNMPFMDIGRLPDPSKPLESARELLAQSSPQIKVPLELGSNTNFFFNSPIVEEGDDPVTTRLAHIARQLALFNAGEGFFSKQGLDSGLHALNTFGGVKGLSYDYETSKNMAIAEYLKQNGESQK